MTNNTEFLDYESAPAKKMTVSGSQLFIVEPHRILNKVFENPGTPVQLDDTKYLNGVMEASSLTVTMKGDEPDSRRMIIEGTAIYNNELNIDDKDYFSELRKLSATTHAMEDHIHFGNQRFLTDRTSDTMMSIAHFADSHTVTMQNEAHLQKKNRPELAVELEALGLGEIGIERMTNQFYAAFQTHVISLNALSRVLNKKPVSRVFVFTPDGRYHPTDDQEKQTTSVIDLSSKIESQQAIEAPKHVHVKTAAEKITFNDFGGSEHIIAKLEEVAFAFNNPDAMKQWGAEKPQGILLYGPPGTGKTTFARALANAVNGDLWEIKGSEIYGQWMGNSEKAITAIFDEARTKTQPTVMLLDEFEALLDSSPQGTSTTVRSVVGIFKKESAALRDNPDNQVIMFATTNHKDRIDPALLRAGRFDIIEEVNTPTTQERTKIFGKKIAEIMDTLSTDEFNPIGDDIDIEKLARLAEDKTGADIKEIIRRVKMQKAMQQARNRGTAVAPISQADLESAIRNMR